MKDAPDSTELQFKHLAPDVSVAKAAQFAATMHTRRSVRHFSNKAIPLEAVRLAIDAAASAPSGAHKQPWTFCLVTRPDLRAAIREAAEAEEREFYERRAPDSWLQDLTPFGTDASKPMLTDAPALIVVFAQATGPNSEQHYYVRESVGIATGFLIAALHQAGLATLTHTPSPMAFLASLLGRPSNERAFVLLPVGYPVDGCRVPVLERKTRTEYLVEYL